jgi:pimeloyl-ACP methyl ester carboxylesterase
VDQDKQIFWMLPAATPPVTSKKSTLEIKETIMQKVTSKDGTQIAYDRQGQGPAVILVDGALCFRSFGPMPGLAKLLEPDFTVYTYDRRGRGDSSDTQPYAVEREVEDLDALIKAAGNSAYLVGLSSGGALVLETAARLGDKVKKIAIYEAPYRAGEDAIREWKDYRKQLNDLLAAGRRGDAAALFMNFVGTPAEMMDGMRQSPVWPVFEAVAPTLAYDAADLGEDRTVPVARAARVTASTLAMNGGAGFPFMYDSAKTIANAIPHAQLCTLEGQRHDVSVEVLAPVLVEFFKS